MKLYRPKAICLIILTLVSVLSPLLSSFVQPAYAVNIKINEIINNLRPEESARMKLMYQTMLECMNNTRKYSSVDINVYTDYGSDGLSDSDKEASSKGFLDLNSVYFSVTDSGWFKDAKTSKIPQQIWKTYGDFSCSSGTSNFVTTFFDAFQIDYVDAAPGGEFYDLVCGADGKQGLFTGVKTEELTYYYDGGPMGLGRGHKGDYGRRKRIKQDCVFVVQKATSNQALSGTQKEDFGDDGEQTMTWKYGLMYATNAEQYLIDWLSNNRGINKANMFMFTDAELYWVYRNQIVNVCSANQEIAGAMPNNQSFSFYDVETGTERHYMNSYLLPKDKFEGDVYLTNSSGYPAEKKKCEDLSTAIGDVESQYVKAALAVIESVNSQLEEGQEPGKWMKVNCYLKGEGEKAAPISKSCSFSELLAISKSVNYSDTDGVGPVCSIETIGWIVCPVLNVLNGIAGALYSVVEDWLTLRVDIVSSAETESAWGQIRNIANIGFVIIFLIVIISQLTGIGISNYGIKKLLPKLIISVILINLSFIICQIAVDLSNVLGFGIKEFLKNVTTATVAPAGTGGTVGGGVLAIILSGTVGIALIVAMGWQFIAMLIIALITMTVAIGLMFLVLLVRQVGVVILMVIAPIAVLAYLLPNTEKYAKMWGSWFMKLLILFPVCSFLVGMGAMVSNIINIAGQGEIMFGLIGGVCLVIPYFLVFKTLKGAMNTFGNLSSLPGKLGGKAKDSRMGRYFQDRHDQDKRNISLGSYTGRNPLNKFRSNMSGNKNKILSRAPGVGGYYQTKMAAGAAEIEKQDEIEVANEMARLKQIKGTGVDPFSKLNSKDTNERSTAVTAFKKLSANQQTANIRYASTLGLPGRNAARTMIDQGLEGADDAKIRNSLVNSSDISSAPDIGEWAKVGGSRSAAFQSQVGSYGADKLASMKIDSVMAAGDSITQENASQFLTTESSKSMDYEARELLQLRAKGYNAVDVQAIKTNVDNRVKIAERENKSAGEIQQLRESYYRDTPNKDETRVNIRNA